MLASDQRGEGVWSMDGVVGRLEEMKKTYRPMNVLEVGVYRGPHLYSATPMIRIQLDLRDLEASPTNRLPGFVDQLIRLLPGVGQHGCSFRKPGGFLIRLHDGTWLGHVVEHVAIELQSLTGSHVTRGITRSVKCREGVYDVLYAYEEEEIGLLAGRHALQLVDSLLPLELRGIEGLAEFPEGVVQQEATA